MTSARNRRIFTCAGLALVSPGAHAAPSLAWLPQELKDDLAITPMELLAVHKPAFERALGKAGLQGRREISRLCRELVREEAIIFPSLEFLLSLVKEELSPSISTFRKLARVAEVLASDTDRRHDLLTARLPGWAFANATLDYEPRCEEHFDDTVHDGNPVVRFTKALYLASCKKERLQEIEILTKGFQGVIFLPEISPPPDEKARISLETRKITSEEAARIEIWGRFHRKRFHSVTEIPARPR